MINFILGYTIGGLTTSVIIFSWKTLMDTKSRVYSKENHRNIPIMPITIPMPVKPQNKLTEFEKIEDLKPLIDAALILNLSFFIYNREIGSKEHPIIVYCFELGRRLSSANY